MADGTYGVTDNWDPRAIQPQEKEPSVAQKLASLLGMDTPEGAAASMLPTPMALIGEGAGVPLIKKAVDAIKEKYGKDVPMVARAAVLQLANKYPRLFEAAFPEEHAAADKVLEMARREAPKRELEKVLQVPQSGQREMRAWAWAKQQLPPFQRPAQTLSARQREYWRAKEEAYLKQVRELEKQYPGE